MQWALWTDDDLVGASNPQALATMTPSYNENEYPASAVGFYSGNCPDPSQLFYIYYAELPCAYWDWQHRGFVYAGVSGDYTFTLPSGVDDDLFVWVGDDTVVRSTYSLDNAALVYRLDTAALVDSASSFVYTANAGEYIPLRIQFSQDTGPWLFGVTITSPDGSTILDGNNQSSALVRFACDGSTPEWLPWGAEA